MGFDSHFKLSDNYLIDAINVLQNYENTNKKNNLTFNNKINPKNWGLYNNKK
jgi:hypothetical protein